MAAKQKNAKAQAILDGINADNSEDKVRTRHAAASMTFGHFQPAWIVWSLSTCMDSLLLALAPFSLTFVVVL